MNKTVLTVLSILGSAFILSACSNQSYQTLQSVNQGLGQAQRSVDYANSVKKTLPQDKGQALKNAGKAIVQQNPNYQQAQETVRASKALANSVKAMNQ